MAQLIRMSCHPKRDDMDSAEGELTRFHPFMTPAASLMPLFPLEVPLLINLGLQGDSISSSDKVLQQTLAFPMSQTRDPYHEATFYAHPDEEPPSNFDRRNQEFQDWGTISIHVPISLDQLPLREDDIGGQSRVFDYDLHINSKGESINVVAFSAETGAKVGELLLKDVA